MAGMNISTRSDSELHLVPRRDVGAKYFPALKLATTSTLTDPIEQSFNGTTKSMQPAWYSFKPGETVLSYRSGSTYRMEHDPLFMAETYGEFRRAVMDEGVPKSDYDNGHPFVSRSVYLQPAKVFSLTQGTKSVRFSPLPYVPTFLNVPTIGAQSDDWRHVGVSRATEGNLDAWGTDAFNKVVPTKPQMSVTNFLGELVKDGFPSLVGLATAKVTRRNHDVDYKRYLYESYIGKKDSYSKAFAKEHLNFQFAVKPLLADLKSFYKTVRDFNSILAQYERDSGRLVRRQRYEERPIETAQHTGLHTLTAHRQFNVPQGRLPSYSPVNSTTFERTTYQSYSFSGGFMYYVPTDPGVANNLLRIESNLKKLFGAPLSPEVVWNLMPWTWLSDWLANVGTILGNYQALQTDDLAMKYGYVTRRTVHDLRVTTNLKYTTLSGEVRYEKYGALVQLAETIRQAATPFGFGLSMDSFSPRQWSILAALGFTLGPQAFKKSS